MKLFFCLIFIVVSLPPFNFGFFGLIFYLPLFSLLDNSDHKNDLLFGAIFGAVLSLYIYLGVYSYTTGVFIAVVIVFILLSSLLFFFIGQILRKFPLASTVLIGFICVLYDITLELFSIPLSHSLVITSIPKLIQSLNIGGTYLLTWMLVSFQACIYIIFKQLVKTNFSDSSPFIPLTMLLLISSATLCSFKFSFIDSSNKLNIAVVQTNTHPFDYLNFANDGILTKSIHQREILLSRLAKLKNLNFVLWPESSSLGYEFRQPKKYLPNDNITHLVNSRDLTPSGLKRISMFSIRNNKVIHSSSKNLLIPFLESSLSQNINSPVHKINFGNIGSLVCFESGFAKPAIHLSNENANLITISTSDAYAGPSILALFHSRFAILRAVENQRYVLRSANAGLSAIVSNRGEIIAATNLYTQDIIQAQISLFDKKSFYSKTYYLWHYGFLFLGIMTLILCLTSVSFNKIFIRKNHLSTLNILSYILLSFILLVFEIVFASHLYNQANNNSNFIYKATFSDAYSTKNLNYNNLLTENIDHSLFSSLAYIARTYGYSINSQDVLDIAKELQATQIAAIDASQIVKKLGFKLESIDIKNNRFKFPLIFQTIHGEYIVLVSISDSEATVFSPFLGLLIFDQEYFFNTTSQNAPLYLATQKRNWD